MSKSRVIAGDYMGKEVVTASMFGRTVAYIQVKTFPDIVTVDLNKNTVEFYEVIDGRNIGRSAVKAVGLSAVGAALIGPIGLLAGMGSKNRSLYNVVISFKDGKSSLLEITDKDYSRLMSVLFGLQYR